MADLIYMSKAAWTAITDTVRNKTGKTGLLKAGDVPGELSDLIGMESILTGNGITKLSNADVYEIKQYCCYQFRDLQEVDFATAENVYDKAFEFCHNLKIVNIPNLRYVADYAFANSANIESITLTKLFNVGDSAFSYCELTGKLTLEEIGYLNSYCFDYNNFSEIDITPSECGCEIWMYVFSDNPNLTRIIIRGTTMPELYGGTSAFIDTPIGNLTGEILVEPSMVDTYKTSSNWSSYASIIKPIS